MLVLVDLSFNQKSNGIKILYMASSFQGAVFSRFSDDFRGIEAGVQIRESFLTGHKFTNLLKSVS